MNISVEIKGTSNYLAEFQNPLKLTLKFSGFLSDIRDILPYIILLEKHITIDIIRYL